MGLSGPLIFYGVSGPSAARDFTLAMYGTKLRFFTWFWAPGGGPGWKNWHLKIVSA